MTKFLEPFVCGQTGVPFSQHKILYQNFDGINSTFSTDVANIACQ